MCFTYFTIYYCCWNFTIRSLSACIPYNTIIIYDLDCKNKIHFYTFHNAHMAVKYMPRPPFIITNDIFNWKWFEMKTRLETRQDLAKETLETSYSYSLIQLEVTEGGARRGDITPTTGGKSRRAAVALRRPHIVNWFVIQLDFLHAKNVQFFSCCKTLF